MSKSGKQYLKPGFLANKNQTDHGRKSNKKSKANDTRLKATGFKHTTSSSVHPIRLNGNGNGKRVRAEVNDLDYNPSGEEDDSDDDSVGSFKQEATEIPDQMESSMLPQSPRSTTGSQLVTPHNGASNGSKTSNRGRGVARGFEVKRRMKTGGKIKGVIIDEDKWLPVGPAEKIFKMEIGIITRLLVPLNVFYWKRMTAAKKAPLFERLESEFDVKFEDQHTRNVVDQIMAKRFRLFKHRCHLHYQKFSIEEAPQHPPVNVDPLDWIPLCEHFKSEDFQKQSKAGKNNRGDLEVSHTSGSKSFLQRLYEMENPENGKEPEEPSQVKLYKETHVHTKPGPKQGTWVHSKAAENHEKMEMLKNQPVQEDGNKLTEDDIREDVLKTKTGYSRGLGYGVKPCKTTSSGASARIQAQRTEAAEKHAEEADKRAKEADKRAEEADKRAAEAEKQAKKFHEEIQDQRSTITKLEDSQLNLQQAFQRFVARFDGGNP